MTTFVSGAASWAILLLAAPDRNRIVQGDCKYSDVHKMTYCETTEIFWRWELQSDHSCHLFIAKVGMLSLPHSTFTQGQSVVRLGSLQLVHVRVEWSLWERWGKEGERHFLQTITNSTACISADAAHEWVRHHGQERLHQELEQLRGAGRGEVPHHRGQCRHSAAIVFLSSLMSFQGILGNTSEGLRQFKTRIKV